MTGNYGDEVTLMLLCLAASDLNDSRGTGHEHGSFSVPRQCDVIYCRLVDAAVSRIPGVTSRR